MEDIKPCFLSIRNDCIRFYTRDLGMVQINVVHDKKVYEIRLTNIVFLMFAKKNY